MRTILAALSISVLLTTAAPACQEVFSVNSGPNSSWLGLHISGVNYGQGQSFTLDCGSRLEIVTFYLGWGNDYGDVRSLAYGDTIRVAVQTPSGEELGRTHWVVDGGEGSRMIDFDFRSLNILLPVGTYHAVCWTEVDACGGVRSLTGDMVAGSRIQSTTPEDPVSWSAQIGEAVHRIEVDSDVTPAERSSWGGVKGCYR